MHGSHCMLALKGHALTVTGMVSPSAQRCAAVLFDLDDTLYTVSDLARRVWNDAAAELVEVGIDTRALTAAYDRCRVGRAWEDALAATRAALSLTPPQARLIRLLAETRVPRELAPRPGLVDLLDELRSAGVATAIVTAGGYERQHAKVAALGLRELVDVVVVADGTSVPGKPDPASFLLALEQLSSVPADAVMVGDRPSRDIAPALTLGMVTGRYVGGHYELEPSAAGTHYETRCPLALWNFVRARTASRISGVA